MSGFRPVEMPDFGATWQRGQAFADAREQNALARMMQMRQFEQQQQFENVLAKPDVSGGLLSTDPAARSAAISALATHAGPHGFQMAMPLIQQDRQQAMDRELFNLPTAPGGGMRAPAATPAVAPAGGIDPSRIIQAESGGDPNARNPRSTASGILQITDPMWNTYAQRLNLRPEQRNDPNAQRAVFAAFAQEQVPQLRQTLGREPNTGDLYGAWALGPAGFRALAANPGENAMEAYARVAGPEMARRAFTSNPGLLEPNMTGAQVLAALRSRVEGGGGAPAGAAPQRPAAPGGGIPGAPSLEWVMAAQRSSNPRMQAAAATWLPILTRAPNVQMAEVNGRRIAIRDGDTSNPIDMGPAQDPNGPVPAGQRREGDRLIDLENGPQAGERANRDFGNTRNLRTEFADGQEVKDFRTVAPRVEAIRRAFPNNTRASDLDMVYAFANLLDPGSVVKEGEQLMVRRTGGIGDSVMGWVNGLNGGATLTPDIRRDLLQQAESRFSTYTEAYNNRLTYFRGLAQENGFNPDHIGRLERPGAPRPANAPQHPNGGLTPAPPGTTPQLRWNPMTGTLVPVGTP